MAAVAATVPLITPTDRLGLTLCLAILFHAIVILGVGFQHRDRITPRFETLDIVLVQTRSEEAPPEAQFLAQANQLGGGEDEETQRPSSPLYAPLPAAVAAVPTAPMPPPIMEPQPASRAAASMRPEPMPVRPAPRRETARAAKPAEPVHELAAETQTPETTVAKPATPPKGKAQHEPAKTESEDPSVTELAAGSEQPQAEQSPASPSAAILVARSFAIASLNAEIQNQLENKSKRPRRKFISANTREYKYAAYMEAWRAKVERVGNLNYPDEARREKLSGSLILDVALNADGSINELTVRRPSGHQVLDDAAVRIVRLAAPYAPFPEEFNKDVDILHITRTWQFQNSSRFTASR